MSGVEVIQSQHAAETRDGWQLELHCVRGDVRRAHPVVIVPGYAMNSTVLAYRPQGTSLVAALVAAGYEVWSLNLRGAGRSRLLRSCAAPPSLAAYVREDLPTALDFVRSEATVGRVDPFCIGASLGGAVVYSHLARSGGEGIRGIVTLGAPLRWEAVPPILRTAFRSRRLARMVPMKGTGRLARLLMSSLARVGLLGAYVNRQRLDPNHTQAIEETLEDPTPELNAEIAEWMRARDLYLDGTNVTRAMGAVETPLLVVLANRDGLVPPPAARSAAAAWGGDDVEVIQVGTEYDWFAHADLFAAIDAPQRVFAPITRWLDDRDGGDPDAPLASRR